MTQPGFNDDDIVDPPPSSSRSKRLLPILSVAAALLFAGTSLAPFLLDSPSSTSRTQVETRLAQVPVFAVTDPQGRPYIAEKQDGRRLGYFFLDPTQAEEFLQQTKESLGTSTPDTDVQIFPVTLQAALDVARNAGRKTELGSDQFVILANPREIEVAKSLIGSTSSIQGVPLFFIDGLAVMDPHTTGGDQEPVIPLFFNKEDLDLLLKKATEKNQSLDFSQSPVEVVELATALDEMTQGKNPRLRNVAFFPPSDGMEYLKSIEAKLK